MYECIICDYKTERSVDLKRHNNSKKHMKNIHLNNLNINNDNNNNCSNNATQNTKNSLKLTFKNNANIECCANATLNATPNVTLNDSDKQTFKKNENTLSKYICNCGKKFSHHSSLYRHKSTCNGINPLDEIEKLKTQVNEIEQFKNTIVNMHNIILDLKNKMDKQVTKTNVTNATNDLINYSHNTNSNNNFIDNSIKNISNQKQINVYNYVSQNYQNAKPLQQIEQDKITEMLIYEEKTNKTHSIEDILVHYYNKKILDQYLGNLILKEYRKQNPSEQQIWTGDVSRLSFIIKSIVNQDEKIWLHDKKGCQQLSRFLTILNNFLIYCSSFQPLLLLIFVCYIFFFHSFLPQIRSLFVTHPLPSLLLVPSLLFHSLLLFFHLNIFLLYVLSSHIQILLIYLYGLLPILLFFLLFLVLLFFVFLFLLNLFHFLYLLLIHI